MILCDWERLVEKIEKGDPDGVEELYSILSETVRANSYRAIGPQLLEDAVHEVLVIVLQAIRCRELRKPSGLMGFMRKVAHRHAVAQIRRAIFLRRKFADAGLPDAVAPRRDSPDNRLDQRERYKRAQRVLRRLSARDREILERFYLREQPRSQICGEMHLTDTQFRLFKSRAIAKCTMFAGAFPGVSRPVRSESRIA